MRQAFQAELQNYHKEGSAFWNELKITPITNKEGRSYAEFG